MRTRIMWCAIWLLAVAASVCQADEAEDVAAVSKALNAFAVDTYKAAPKGDGNFVCSPIGISLAFGLVYGGTRGETEAQLARAMHNELGQERFQQAFFALRGDIEASVKKTGATLRVANLLAVQQDYPVQPAFVELAAKLYGAPVVQRNFATDAERVRQEFNAWGKQQTGGKVADLMPPGSVNDLTRLLVVNAIYFKAKWAYPFEKEETEEAIFHTSQKRQVIVPTMYQKDYFSYGQSETVQALWLPYSNGRLGMMIVLPFQRDGLTAIETALQPETFKRWWEMLQPPHNTEVRIFLPRFEIDSSLDLVANLTANGVTDLFTAGNADLTGFSTREALYVTTARHRSGIRVDEEGTIAVAATQAATGGFGDPPPPPPLAVFRADHPFLYFIIDRQTGLILFMGRVTNPKAP